MGWASVADVFDATGVTVTSTQLAQAAATVEVHSGRPYSADVAAVTGTRDTLWLRRAECFQAAWLPAQPDLFQRMNVTSVTSEGGTSQLTHDALTLAPLAARAIARLSWKRSRSVMARRARALDDLAAIDSDDDWRPMRVRF